MLDWAGDRFHQQTGNDRDLQIGSAYVKKGEPHSISVSAAKPGAFRNVSTSDAVEN